MAQRTPLTGPVVGSVPAGHRGRNMVAYFPAPALCQGADEDLMIEMGAIIFPDFVQRTPGANGLRLRLEGDYRDDSLMKTAADQFQTLLGILRAWRPVAGQRVDEVRRVIPGT